LHPAPRNADCWTVLSLVYAHEYGPGFNPLPGALQRAEAAARRAVDLAPGNHLAHQKAGMTIDQSGRLAGGEFSAMV
jgi:hypothetical protein